MIADKPDISIKTLIGILKSLNDEERDEIFEEVFIQTDDKPLFREDRGALTRAEQELRQGETITWPFGG